MDFVHTPRRLWRWADGIVLATILLLAGSLWLFAQGEATEGQAAVITTPTGEQTLSLSRDEEITLVGRDEQTVVIQIQDGRVCFESANCPDQICVRSGWLSQAGQTAACVPAGIAVHITGDPPVDGIAG